MTVSKKDIGCEHLVSSAKSNTVEEDTVLGRSLTIIRHRSGPSMLPRGTPEMTGKGSDRQLLTVTH